MRKKSSKTVTQKRYQYRSFAGIMWSSWFNYDGPKDPIQLKGFKGDNLKNEYREV